MKENFSSEILKLRKSHIFIFCNVVLGVIAVASIVSTYLLEPNSQDFNGSNILFSRIGDNIPLVFMMIFVSVYVENEFSTGRIKIILSKCSSRQEFYFSKLLICMIGVGITNIVSSVVYVVCATAVNGFDPKGKFSLASFLVFFGLQLLVYSSYTAIFCCVSFLIKTVYGAIVVNLLIILLFPGVFLIMDNLLKTGGMLSKYWLSSCMMNLLNNITYLTFINTVIPCVLFIAVSSFIGIHFFEKKDL